jgi:hypothetical protein
LINTEEKQLLLQQKNNKSQVYFFAFSNFFLLTAINNTGSNIRFVKVAINKVNEVSHPNACVLPNPLNTKMMNPAINTKEVYIILMPVSLIV